MELPRDIRVAGRIGVWGACVLGVGLAAALLCTGCTHVIAQNAPYYNEGPQQPGPPDGELAAGTGVWIVGQKDGYGHIWTLGGVNAYVWPRDIVTKAEWAHMQKVQADAEQAAEAALTSRPSPPPAARK